MNAVMGLEARGVLRARWLVASLMLAAGLVGFFLVVATRESAIVEFTGFGRVMGGVVQASLLFVPLLALFSTSQAVPRALQDGVLEWYLAHPTSRDRCFWALTLPRLGAVALPVTAAVAGLGLLAGNGVSMGLFGSFLALLVGQSLCFGGIGMWIGASSSTPEQALLRALVVWMAAAVLVDFVLLGVLLRWDLPPAAIFTLAALNPVQAGRVGILAAVDAEMGAIGPVGTWAAVTLGQTLTVGWGLGWPFVLGIGSLLAARRAFARRDVV